MFGFSCFFFRLGRGVFAEGAPGDRPQHAVVRHRRNGRGTLRHVTLTHVPRYWTYVCVREVRVQYWSEVSVMESPPWKDRHDSFRRLFVGSVVVFRKVYVQGNSSWGVSSYTPLFGWVNLCVQPEQSGRFSWMEMLLIQQIRCLILVLVKKGALRPPIPLRRDFFAPRDDSHVRQGKYRALE